MSLTSLIKKRGGPNAVADFFSTRLPNLDGVRQRFREAGPITLPRLGPVRRAGTVGTAFDYRARYWFSTTDPRELVAAKGGAAMLGRYLSSLCPPEGRVELTRSQVEDHDPYQRLARALAAFTAQHPPAGRLLDEENERGLCRFCLALALFDPVFRSGHYPPELMAVGTQATVEDLLGIATDEEVDDLCRLSAAFGDTAGHLIGAATPHLNPVFAGSLDIGGADADLVIGGCLLDLKAVAGRFERHWVHQLAGYALLDYDDQYRIRRVGFYFARHPVVLDWDLMDLLAEMAGFPVEIQDLRVSFQEAVVAERQARRAILTASPENDEPRRAP